MDYSENWSTHELKSWLKGHYALLKIVDNYRDEELIDNSAHDIEKTLEKRGIYVRKRIKLVFMKIKKGHV